MTIASGSLHRLACIAEVTYGTTPATPAFTTIRHTACSIGLSKDAVESDEIRGDRQRTQFRHGNKQVAGDVEAELIYGEYDGLLEAAMCGTWSTDVLKAGTTRRSFTFERTFQDITQYLRYKGCEIGGFNLKLSPNKMVSLGFSVVGQDQDAPAGTAIAGSSYSSLSSTAQFDSFNAVITEGGGAIAVITEAEIKLENGIEPQFVIGSALTTRPAIGRSLVSGSITAYFENATLLNKFLNETESALDITLTDPAGNTLQFTIGALKYTSGQPDVGGEGSVTISMDFEAYYDTSDASNIVITRNPV